MTTNLQDRAMPAAASPPTTDATIRVRGVVKSYGDVRALDGVDLEAQAGTVLGLLGPNGAGKTTAVRVMTTLLKPDAGEIEVAGLDAVRQAAELRERIGLAGQYAAVDENLTGAENLTMVGRLYGMPRAAAKQRAQELLDRFDLTAAGGRPARGYSGGMRRRLDLAAALVARPPVLFLDEPTTGLDPRSRLALWETIEERVSQGSTVVPSATRPSIVAHRSRRLRGSRPVVGSSRKSTGGSATSAAARSSRRRMPPE
jgi:ABC-2 type transport system ATP-binding protein